MELLGTNSGKAWGASGVDGFFGEGYAHHPLLKLLFGVDLNRVVFTAKTTVLLSREGNLPLNREFKPLYPLARCVRIKFVRGVMLNAVGLSGPGIGALLGTGKWQQRTKPFWLSVMSVARTTKQRMEELRIIVDMLGFCLGDFRARIGVHINLSCPNAEDDPAILFHESSQALDVASPLRAAGVPLMLKYSIASAPPKQVAELNDHPYLDGICVSNTLPFGWPGIDWMKVWGSNISPLARFGGGGLSGAPLRRLGCDWIKEVRDRGFLKHINGGGGILHPKHVDDYHAADASSVFIGSVVNLRPWQFNGIISRANKLTWPT